MYCTVSDVKAALTPGASEATSAEATAVNLPNWQIEDAIAEATGTVRLYVAGRYTVPEPDTEITEYPLSDPPTQTTVALAPYPVRGWTRNVAAYLLTLTFKRNQDLKKDDPIRLRHIMTMGQLEAVRNRSLDIPGFVIVDSDDQGVHVENLYQGQLFSLEDFMLTSEGVSGASVLWPLREYNGGS